MDSIGIRQLRASAAATVRRAAAGERIVVTVDGRPLAQLGPVEAPASHGTVTDLEAAGLLIPPRRHGRAAPEPEPVAAWAGARLDRLLRELRG